MATADPSQLKRKAVEEVDSSEKKMKTDHDGVSKKATPSKGRMLRLEQNRRAAKESRRRKKTLIEDLQRSVIFFSRANQTIQQQNQDLSRLLMQAQTQVAMIESSGEKQSATGTATTSVSVPPAPATLPGTPAPPAADAGVPASAAAAAMAGTLPPMQPGATMQAMANFQQAAAAAMQAAVQGMKGIPGVSMQALAAPAVGVGTTAYNDTMTALAMQKAAAAAAAAGSVGQLPYFQQAQPQLTHPETIKKETS